MTRLKFNVKAHKSWPIATRSLVKEAATWGINRLNIDTQPITILFRFMGRHREETLGDCVNLNKKFILHLYADKSIRRTVSTVFHELTHVKQYVHDGFEMDYHSAIWQKKIIVLDKADYFDFPWEVEARESERILRKEFWTRQK